MSIAQMVSWCLALLGAACVAFALLAQDWFTGYGTGEVTLLVGGLGGVTSFITAWMFRHRDAGRARLRAGKDLLVRWSYAEGEWRIFARAEYERQRAEKRLLLKILGIVAIVVVVAGALFDLTFGGWMAGLLGVTWVLCWLASRAALRPYRRNEQGGAPEARISSDGLLLGAEYHLWRGWGNRLEEVGLEEGPPLKVLIKYSVPGGRGRRNEVIASVPVPAGREQEAVTLLQRLERRKR